ncbi:PTS fructose transporter subunit IIA [Candidatus Epulonipiscioides gigas]|nr:PTS fructose transporter subunit IIA [Epulopiscium sp. SCG-C07WGA-EpuloA2]ONI44842.1 PTS fructose transporter subunit IIA [Epulopiscium sp. SCG-C07WGA-EpuloA2]
MIWEDLENNLIHINVNAITIAQIMEKVGRNFIKEGYCKKSFVEALITREIEFPTALDIDGIGVAIPHTDISHVNKAKISIATLKQPITFTHMGTDDEAVDVSLIFMLAINEPNAHIDKIQQIISIIQDKQVLENLLNAKNKQAIIDIIREKEQSL